jgi:hypothetical protein
LPVFNLGMAGTHDSARQNVGVRHYFLFSHAEISDEIRFSNWTRSR